MKAGCNGIGHVVDPDVLQDTEQPPTPTTHMQRGRGEGSHLHVDGVVLRQQQAQLGVVLLVVVGHVGVAARALQDVALRGWGVVGVN